MLIGFACENLEHGNGFDDQRKRANWERTSRVDNSKITVCNKNDERAGLPVPELTTRIWMSAFDFLFGRPGSRRLKPATAGLRPPLAVERLESRTLLSSADNLLFVTRAYQDLFNRAIDAGGLAYVSALNRALTTRFQLAETLQASLENRFDQVERLYTQYLHRPADPTGLNDGIGFLSGTGTVEQLAAVLAGSLEYFQTRAGGTFTAFLSAFYLDALGRAADPTALSVFGPGLAQGTFTTGQVAANILHSPEYQFDLVGGFYLQFLHRPADLPGQTAFVSLLQTGSRDEDVIAGILASEEFAPNALEPTFLAKEEVEQLLQRAAGASAHNDAIIAVVDRGGRVLGVRVEAGVSPQLTGNAGSLVFAVDGALAEARTAAFFANDQAPLTSRTVQFISQSTITQREVDSNPNITDPNSPLRGPGFVAPVGLGGHFPPNVPFTPPVDLFGIEHTNRDSILHPGPDHIKSPTDYIKLQGRFNINPAFVPAGKALPPPESYGYLSGIMPFSQSRGIGTLPGGIPLYKQGELVGGIGVFFPGQTGSASEENSSLSATFNPALPDRSVEAEYMAFAAAGGSSAAVASVGTIAGIPPLPGFDLPFGRIDLAGVTLDIFGPGGDQGPANLLQVGTFLGVGNPFGGKDIPVDPGVILQDGIPVPDGWLVVPHNGTQLTAADVAQIINQGIAEAMKVRAQIRLPIGVRTKMVFAVTDTATGEVLGLYRMPDATVFSIDVAVAKGRNVGYYDNPLQLQPIDQIAGLPAGVAFTNRTFRYTAQPRFPEGIDGTPPGPHSILNDPGINPANGLDSGPPLPASDYQSVYGFDSFNPGSNFRSPVNPANQNGVVFFPGSSAVYKTINGVPIIVGGLGVSGDGVDQDDVITSFAAAGYEPPVAIRADQFTVRGVSLPYQKFPRNPEA
jgi:uncharacterized protein GlcG (DUF336 family)